MVGAEEEERVSSGGGVRGGGTGRCGGDLAVPTLTCCSQGWLRTTGAASHRPGGQKDGMKRGRARAPEAPGAPAPCRRLQLRVAARLWPQPPISASGVTPPSPPLRPISLSFHLIRIHVIAFGAHLDNPGHSPFQNPEFNRICNDFATCGHTYGFQGLNPDTSGCQLTLPQQDRGTHPCCQGE